jgi:DNA-binding LacI/PurR family transcriptional regulator
VSRATVSYVLNERADQSIPEATRQRVLAAAAELKYVPNAASRALRAGESRLVLLVNPGLPWGSNLRTLVDTLTSLAARSGLSLVMWHRLEADGLPSVLAHLEPRIVVTLGDLGARDEGVLSDVGIPLVDASVDTARTSGGAPSELQVRHLAARGHRRIGYLSTGDPARRVFAAPRVDGASRACRDLGLPEPRVAELPPAANLTLDAVVQVLARWRSGPDPVTGVACYNDYVASAALAAAGALGLAVPEDVAVVGIDDEPYAGFTRPSLTTVRFDMAAFGARVWAGAERLLGGERVPEAASVIPVALVERGSA